MKPDHVFISGVSRTGSTLLLKILNKSPGIAVCRENNFLGHQISREGVRYAIRREVGDWSDDAGVRRLVEFLYTGEFKRCNDTYWKWLRSKTDKEAFLQKLTVASERNDRAIFATMMEMYGDWLQQKRGTVCDDLILGEKTPPHIYYVPTLLEWFPNSRVIHTFRDPRGIFASELRRRKRMPVTFPFKQLRRISPLFTLYVLLQVTYAWVRAVKLHLEYKRLYSKRYYLLRFEDLVTDPDSTIKKLCSFLEISFQDEMLKQKVVSAGFKSGQAGFDKRAANRWQEVNSSWINAWFLFWGRKHLKALGYMG